MNKPSYVVVKVDTRFVSELRKMLHESNLIEGDISFSPNAHGWFYRSPTRDNDLAKYDKLATVYDTTIEYCRREKNGTR